ncbi:hypothetical protein T02_12912 [Trichinella nativa]|uniref:Uncharacterized protein n=1 Tax=Trichinella nativa TaxID=6335 RepID=A0A0V1LJW8_9BILA|nr:hypothetical protein T02_12912 [Trichinella nativa]
MALNFHVKTCGGVFWLRQCFCYGVFLSDSLYFDNMRDNKDQMTVSVIRSVYMFGKATIKFSFQTECIS